MNIEIEQIANLITEDPNEVKKYFAAVAVVHRRDKWLLGLSTASDDRKDKWCFPGGGIKNSEKPETAACRECKEETNISCTAAGKAFEVRNKPGVAFVHCRATSETYKPNHEFTAMGWFTRRQMRQLKLYNNVLSLIDRVT